MCNCNGSVIVTLFSHICTECGSEVPFVSPQIQTFHEQPRCGIVTSPYSRKQRFIILLRKILGVDNGPRHKDRVWRVLANSAPFRTTDDIISCLKHSSLRSKHYTSLHVFAKLYLTHYTPPVCDLSPHEIENKMDVLFDEVEFLWCRYQSSKSFFSYAWLLEKLLRHINVFPSYSQYLKVLVCPNRRHKYHTRWKSLTTLLPPNSPLYHYDMPPKPLETVSKYCA